jgi:hypothetical protein
MFGRVYFGRLAFSYSTRAFWQKPLPLFRYPIYVADNPLISHEAFLSIEVPGEFFFIGDDAVDSLMALPANTNTPMGHFFFAE